MMPTTKRGLGRGLGALLPPGVPTALAPGVREVDVESIVPNPRQPRHKVNPKDVRELADSIKEHGLIQPLIVTSAAGSNADEPRFQLIAGERRWTAAKMAGLERVPVIVRGATPEEMLELALVENIQRADLNPLEEASAYKQLMDDFGMTQEQVATKVGKDRVTVANALRLLKLPQDIQSAIADETISEGHARAIQTVADDRQQKSLLRTVIARAYSVRQTEETARRLNEKLKRHKPKTSEHDAPAGTRALEEELRKALGTKVQVFRSRRGGKIVVNFYSEEELHSIYERIVGKK
jgi:ParB family transcriptional regulator, chromosome partitioning protein